MMPRLPLKWAVPVLVPMLWSAIGFPIKESVMRQLAPKFLTALLLISLAAFNNAALAEAKHRGTPAEAKALLKDAVQYMDEQGREKALAEFNKKKSDFVRGDLYIFAVDMEGTYLASAANPKLVGQNFYQQNADAGRELNQNMSELVQKVGYGIIEYEWLNRQTNKLETKFSYVRKVGDVTLGVGFYLPR